MTAWIAWQLSWKLTTVRLWSVSSFAFTPGCAAARELLASGAIGQPVSAQATWGEFLPDWHPWEDYRQSYSARSDLGGGVLLTLSHPFDYLRWFFGDVQTVTGEMGHSAELDLDVEDTADVLLRFRSGVTASVHLDYHRRPAEHHLTVVGTRGSLAWNNATGGMRWWSDESGSWQSVPAPPGFERNVMFVEEMRHFVDVAEGRSDPVCSLADGMAALQVALAARASAEGGRRVELV